MLVPSGAAPLALAGLSKRYPILLFQTAAETELKAKVTITYKCDNCKQTFDTEGGRVFNSLRDPVLIEMCGKCLAASDNRC